MRRHKKKLVYVPDNTVDGYDYESDGVDEEIGVVSRGRRRRRYHYDDDSTSSLSSKISQFLLLCLFLVILYSAISPDNGILGIEFKGSLSDNVIKGASSLQNFGNDLTKNKARRSKSKPVGGQTKADGNDANKSEFGSGDEADVSDDEDEPVINTETKPIIPPSNEAPENPVLNPPTNENPENPDRSKSQ